MPDASVPTESSARKGTTWLICGAPIRTVLGTSTTTVFERTSAFDDLSANLSTKRHTPIASNFTSFRRRSFASNRLLVDFAADGSPVRLKKTLFSIHCRSNRSEERRVGKE